MWVEMSSSPGRNVGPSTRAIMNVSDVMFGPNTTSCSDEALKKSAIATCAWCDNSVASREVRKWPCMFALHCTIAARIRSSTWCGTCVPAGLSK